MLQINEIIYNSSAYQELIKLRFNILRKPLGLKFDQSFLEKDQNNLMLGAYSDGILIGCVQLQKLSNNIAQLRQMAINPHFQGRGIGKMLVETLEDLAHKRGINYIELHARKSAIQFYEKLGYKQKGAEFTEVGIPHLLMYKQC